MIPNLETRFSRLEKVLIARPINIDKLGYFMYGEYKTILYHIFSKPTKVQKLSCFIRFQSKWWMIGIIAALYGWTDEQIESGFDKAKELIGV
jgi:hypothetical protein